MKPKLKQIQNKLRKLPQFRCLNSALRQQILNGCAPNSWFSDGYMEYFPVISPGARKVTFSPARNYYKPWEWRALSVQFSGGVFCKILKRGIKEIMQGTQQVMDLRPLLHCQVLLLGPTMKTIRRVSVRISFSFYLFKVQTKATDFFLLHNYQLLLLLLHHHLRRGGNQTPSSKG